MKQHSFFAMLVAVMGITSCESNFAIGANYGTAQPYLPVSISVQSDNQGDLREFPLNNDSNHYRAYLQATPNERYSLHVTNNSNQRVGLVIAVDGRNIVNGKQSWLGSNESMYVLDPHDSEDYEGWRTGSDQTNRFYFTQASDSYAAAWGDTSAMGVIAMAVYSERERPRPQVYQQRNNLSVGSAAELKNRGVPNADAAAAPAAAGTGFGEANYSPSTQVEFRPNTEQMEKVVLKYEWSETLCRKGVLQECSRRNTSPGNRMWQDDETIYAPPPPAR